MKILLLGKGGQVGWELQRALAPLGQLIALGRDTADFEQMPRLREVVRDVSPNVIVNAAAYTAVDKAQSEPERALQINATAVRTLAEEASRLDAWLVHYSSDYVFDGKKNVPYVEEDIPAPLSVYGETKLEGERAIRQHHARHLIFRTSWVYGTRGGNFAKTILRLAKERQELKIVADQHGAPTSAELIADVTALALHRIREDPQEQHPLSGIYHLAASGETTWHGYACYVLTQAIDKGARFKAVPESVKPIPTKDYLQAAARPSNSRLDTQKLRTAFDLEPPHWCYSVDRLVQELTSGGAL